MTERKTMGQENTVPFVPIDECKDKAFHYEKADPMSQTRITQLQQTIAIQRQRIAELQAKDTYYDVVLNCKEPIETREFAKEYGWTLQRMITYLLEKEIVFKLNDVWLLFPDYVEKGYTDTEIHSCKCGNGCSILVPNIRWTQKGRLWLYEILKSDGYLPVIEWYSEESEKE